MNSDLKKELSFFEKKYKFKINIMSDSDLIIPEYKIHLLNKNKKIIDKIESIKNFSSVSKVKKINFLKKDHIEKNKKNKETLGRILWVRKKRRKLN